MFVSQYLKNQPEETQPSVESFQTGHGLRILLLGGSVLHPDFGGIQRLLQHSLESKGLSDVHILNASGRAHSSRDSVFKYAFLSRIGYEFDVVVVYHGINEVRANNCPPEVFREDYSHYRWYETLNITHRHLKELDITVIPYCVDYAIRRMRQVSRPHRYLPTHTPPAEWLHHGCEIKSRDSLCANLLYLAQETKNRGEKLVLLSFAYHVPENYSLAAFESKSLDYGRHICPAEIWGIPSNVVKGIQVHNEAVESMVRENPELTFLDINRIIPKSALYFDDICHLTHEGCQLFGQTLAERVVKTVGTD